MNFTKRYNYFEKPDGYDVFKKFTYVMVPATQVATAMAITDVLMWSNPKGYAPTLTRMAYIASPILGASAVFVTTTNALASIRNKDDKLNWVLGGFASGSVFGLWKKSVSIGFNFGLLFALSALVKKYSVEQGWTLFPIDGPIAHMGIGWNPDFTLTKERKPNWVRSASEN